jgi:glycyl-tRNA synthetase beta chain
MKHNQDTLLFELLTEELPIKAVKKLSDALVDGIATHLNKAQFEFKTIKKIATPRRLGFLITELRETQPDQMISRQGPMVQAAFDADGNPTKACLGFAASCKTTVAKLERMPTAKGDKLCFTKTEAGKTIYALIPDLIQEVLKKLPIAKLMRWGAHDYEFVRPVHSSILMYGQTIIEANFFGVKTSNTTSGHRFLADTVITITDPALYAKILQEHFVICDFEARRAKIVDDLEKLSATVNGSAIYDDALLDEVTSLVEWPVSLLASFADDFLTVPQEAIVSSIQVHQKSFPLIDANNRLLAKFITVSNLASKDPNVVIGGNERVMSARLADAKFFFDTDKDIKLETRVDKLKTVIFQHELGSLYDKTLRVQHLAGEIANCLQISKDLVQRAAYLAKTDLLTAMVGEFPELQGIMGYYYAKYQQEDQRVAIALKEQYMPANATDDLPTSNIGEIIAIADRLDTLVGIFGINKIPTGDKDPFAIKRAVFGIIKIIIEHEIDLDLTCLIDKALELYGAQIKNKSCKNQVIDFIFERLKSYVLDAGFATDEYQAVVESIFITSAKLNLLDIFKRIIAVNKFRKLPQAESLSAANKRVGNLLAKDKQSYCAGSCDIDSLQEPAAVNLAKLVTAKKALTAKLALEHNYVELLKELAELKDPIDTFFDNVMVMVDDKTLRLNRLMLLASLRSLFLQVADISFLQH